MKVKRFKKKNKNPKIYTTAGKRSEEATQGVQRERNGTILIVINFKYENTSKEPANLS